MEIIAILDELEERIKESKKVPFSGKSLIEPEYFLDKLDRIRAVLPEEIEAARLVIHEQERIYEEANREAKGFVEDSMYQAARLVETDEITKQAKQVAEEIIAKGQSVALEIHQGANEYADKVMAYLEQVLKESLVSVQKGRSEIKENSRNSY
ncbi:MAG: ATPase [Ignavibacteriales bacterium]